MEVKSKDFVALADITIQDKAMQGAVRRGTHSAYQKRLQAMFSEGDVHGQALRRQAAEAKRRALSRLPELLEQAEEKMTAKGIHVRWAVDAQEACQRVLDIAAKHGVQAVAKSKSMLTEEIGLNHALEDAGIETVETDLGEYIVQIAGDRPSHVIAPVIHMSKDTIRDLFVNKLNMTPTDDAQAMVAFARQKLREVFLDAGMGISGGNFIIAETGSIGLVMNEGNGRMVTSLPKIHIAICGLERVAETLEDYVLLTQVLPRSGTGQQLTVYTNIINGPTDDGDGPEHVYVIFVDNGRSKIYNEAKFAEVLTCIRCGACQNACPVYRSTGGNAYGWVYGGPIGAVVTPLLVGIDKASPLPYASSLCGACKEACPVDIDLPRMLLDLRNELVEDGHRELKYSVGIKSWAIANQSPRLFEMGGKAAHTTIQMGLDHFVPNPIGEWEEYRDFPGFAPKPFRQLWRERKNGGRS